MNVLATTDTSGGGSFETFGNTFRTFVVELSDVEGQVFFFEEFNAISHWRYRSNIVIYGPVPPRDRINE